MGWASGVRNREEGVGRAGCSPLHENLGVMGSCLVLWVYRAGDGGVGILNGSGGVELYFYISLLGLAGCGCERVVFTGEVLECRDWLMSLLRSWRCCSRKIGGRENIGRYGVRTREPRDQTRSG